MWIVRSPWQITENKNTKVTKLKNRLKYLGCSTGSILWQKGVQRVVNVLYCDTNSCVTREGRQRPPLSQYSTCRTRIQEAHCSATRDPAIFHCQLRSSALMWHLWVLTGIKWSYHTHHVNRRVIGSRHSCEPMGRLTTVQAQYKHHMLGVYIMLRYNTKLSRNMTSTVTFIPGFYLHCWEKTIIPVRHRR